MCLRFNVYDGKNLEKISVMGFVVIAEVCYGFRFAFLFAILDTRLLNMVSYYSNNKKSRIEKSRR